MCWVHAFPLDVQGDCPLHRALITVTTGASVESMRRFLLAYPAHEPAQPICVD